MSKEKQIEEMAKVICSSIDCKNCVHRFEIRKCGAMRYAEELYNAGYRKPIESKWMKRGNARHCPNCKYIYYSNGEEWRFCSCCGAKMKGGAE